MEQNLLEKGVQVFANFLLLMIGVQLIQLLLGLSTYGLFYLLLITLLLTIGECFTKARLFCFTIAFFLLDLSLGIILIPVAIFYLKYKGYRPFDILVYNIWGRNNQKNMV